MSDKLALIPKSVNDALSMSDMLSKSSLVPDEFKGKPGNVFLAINYGLELGFPPAASLRAVAVIKGKPTLYADAMVGLVMGSGKAEYFHCIESTDQGATYETKRKGAPTPVRKTFSAEDVRRAQLGGNHKTYPKHMMEARAKSWLARDVYPDLLHGIYSREEASEFADDDAGFSEVPGYDFGAPAQSEAAEQPKLESALDAKLAKLRACKTVAEMEAMAEELAELPGDDREAARREYVAHKARIEGGEAAA